MQRIGLNVVCTYLHQDNSLYGETNRSNSGCVTESDIVTNRHNDTEELQNGSATRDSYPLCFVILTLFTIDVLESDRVQLIHQVQLTDDLVE